MRSAAPRRTTRRSTQTDSLPADRAPDRQASPRLSKQDGASAVRLRHPATPRERRLKDEEQVDAHGNLAAMCLERVGIDLHRPVDEQEVPHRWTQLPTTAATVAGVRDFLLLADMLGLGGAR